MKSHFIVHPKLIEISWPSEISEAILMEQLACKLHLEIEHGDKISEIRLGFNTLSISFSEPVSQSDWEIIFHGLSKLQKISQVGPPKSWKIPVCYDSVLGYDLSFIADTNGLSEKEVIELHCSKAYRLHFYGFLPGFMYLGGLDKNLHTRRKSIPERSIPAGSVAIGAGQTGIYPCESPGGWHVLGRSPLRFFDIKKNPPVIPEINDKVEFFPISLEEFWSIEKGKDTYRWQYD